MQDNSTTRGASSQQKECQSFSLDRALELAESIEFLKELGAILLEDGPRLLEDMRTALADNNDKALMVAAHTFKGAVSNFFAERSRSLAGEIEAAARDGKVEESRPIVAKLEEEWRLLREELKGL